VAFSKLLQLLRDKPGRGGVENELSTELNIMLLSSTARLYEHSGSGKSVLRSRSNAWS
jgi:hypothetical protein